MDEMEEDGVALGVDPLVTDERGVYEALPLMLGVPVTDEELVDDNDAREEAVTEAEFEEVLDVVADGGSRTVAVTVTLATAENVALLEDDTVKVWPDEMETAALVDAVKDATPDVEGGDDSLALSVFSHVGDSDTVGDKVL